MNFRKTQLIIFSAIGVIALLAILVLTGVLPGLRSSQTPPFTLDIWSPTDERGIWENIINTYREGVNTATITYIQKPPDTYEAELLNALASGGGPDIFLLPDAWIAKHGDKIKTLPAGTLGYEKKHLKTLFADGVAEAITNKNHELIGTPLAFDTLALFFNRDYFNSANIPSPPQSWEELAEHAKRLTKFSELGGIRRSGVAVGTAANVRHSADILLALIYQSGGALIDPEASRSVIQNQATASALAFYTAFADSTKKSYSWNAFFAGDSLASFANGETAMAFGYAADVKTIAALNPQLNFDVAPFPQLAPENSQVNYGRFNLLAVSRHSPDAEQAWRFLLWLEGKDIQKTYLDAVGLPPVRRDLVTSKPPRAYLIPFYDQVLSARTIPIPLDDSLPKIMNDMIEGVVNRRFTIEQAISRAGNEITAALVRSEP